MSHVTDEISAVAPDGRSARWADHREQRRAELVRVAARRRERAVRPPTQIGTSVRLLIGDAREHVEAG